MSNAPASLPDDPESLKSLLIEQQQINQHYKAQVISLQEQLNLALARRYAASSEKVSPDQLWIFDEAELDTGYAEGDEGIVTEDDAITVPEHTRKKPGRRALPKALPRVQVIHELPEDQLICDHDGQVLTPIGEVTSEQLDIIPAKIQVIQHVRIKYACTCGQCIKTTPLPGQPIPKSNASPGLLAHIAVSKYQDALPLYRQEKILQRIGVDLPRATLANWMIKSGQLIQPLINLLQDRLLSYDIVQIDETPVQVLNEPGKTAQSKSYLWVRRGGSPQQPVLLYDYDPGRSGKVPVRLLPGFAGYLQTDGYDGYNAVVTTNQLIHAGCMAHARRKFDEAIRAQGKTKKKTGLAHRGLSLINKLYRVEKQARLFSPDERYEHRKKHTQPIIDELRTWLDESRHKVPPTGATGKALAYLDHEWQKLIVYLQDGRLEIDNNKTENAIRPFVIGRKNWLFSASVKGVKSSANLYSLIETTKANGLEPYVYLRHVFTQLPRAKSVEDVEALLPWQVSNDQINIY